MAEEVKKDALVFPLVEFDVHCPLSRTIEDQESARCYFAIKQYVDPGAAAFVITTKGDRYTIHADKLKTVVNMSPWLNVVGDSILHHYGLDLLMKAGREFFIVGVVHTEVVHDQLTSDVHLLVNLVTIRIVETTPDGSKTSQSVKPV